MEYTNINYFYHWNRVNKVGLRVERNMNRKEQDVGEETVYFVWGGGDRQCVFVYVFLSFFLLYLS